MESELYFLILKYLSSGPCKRTAQTLSGEIEEHALMPQRCDWRGFTRNTTFDAVSRLHPHIANDHLLRICARIGPLLEKEIPPSVAGLNSLLGSGRQSLLRTRHIINDRFSSKELSTRRNGSPLCPPPQSKHPRNLVTCLIARENSGPASLRQTFPCKNYARAVEYRRVLGHLSSVYCISFDRTGRFIITGADDSLVKIWSATDGRLLSTLRGHMHEITDLAVNYENTLIAAGSCDKMIRVWCLKSTAPVTVLIGHNALITSLKFCPLMRDENRFLVSTANDGCVCFWKYNGNDFYPRPLKFTERHKPGAHLVCSSFSSGGVFLAVGSTDNYVRVYHVTAPAGPTKILEIEQHSDDVDSLQFSNFSTRFVSGSKDGVAHIWYYERQNWHNIPLRMTERLSPNQLPSEEMSRKLRVSMVGWTCDDAYVITSLSDHSLKVWDSYTGQLKHVLLEHEEEVFVIEAHPKDGRIFLSGGHDGRIVLWNIVSGTVIKKFFNNVDGQGNAAVFDCRFSPDGLTFASTDSHGQLTLFGFGSPEPYRKIPDQIFFHTDYRPLVRDANQYVIDEQTQCAPHLMPPPFLVDIDGNPYPPKLQRLVPGRETATDDTLVPYIAVHNANGVAEVLEPVIRPDENPGPSLQQYANANPNSRATIDDMIERLAQEQQHRNRLNQEHDYYFPHGSPPERDSSHRHSHQQSPRSRQNQRSSIRRSGDEGVRQPAPNWLSHGSALSHVWKKRSVVTPLSLSEFEKIRAKINAFADAETEHFNKERKKRPQLNDATVSLKDAIKQERFTRRKRRIIQQRSGVANAYGRNRYVRRPDGRHRNGIIDFENPEDLAALSDDSDSDFVGSGAEEWKDTSSESSDSEESEDSEWDHDNDITVPGNGRRKKSKRDDNDDEDDADDDNANADDNDGAGPSNGRRADRGPNRKDAKRSKDSKRFEEKYKQFKELPPNFRPPEWLTDSIPRKFPYFPQIGDEIVYFRQGHELYIDAVRQKKSYNINQGLKPYKIKKSIDDEVFARVVDIKYDVKPPRLVTLKLMVINRDDSAPTGEHFSVRYHDMEDVIDFFVLRQIYETSLDREWSIGDEFRAIIDEKWWFGRIIGQEQHNERFPNSLFQCFRVQWESGDEERLSPWDLEPIDESRAPTNRKESIPITPEERLLFYRPNDEEWPLCGREAECVRIARGLARIMEMGHAEEFAYPVDLETLPVYGMTIPYPIDLNTIRSRVENHFYRRLDSIKFELKFIEIDAREFNESGSEIVKKAKIVTSLCLRFIDDPNCDDPMAIYLNLIENHEDFDDPEESDVDTGRDGDFMSVRRNPSRKKRRKRRRSESSDFSSHETKKRAKMSHMTPRTWKQHCRELLDLVFKCEDSSPFRSPVDPIQYPNYSQLIDTPMDLTTVKEQLLADLYDSPKDFCKDMRLIFQNSKTFNTNKRSRIYAMTVRVQSMFEARMRDVASDWRSAINYERRIKSGKYVSKRRRPIIRSDSSTNAVEKKKRIPRKNSRLTSPSSPSLSPVNCQPSTSGHFRSSSGPSHGSNKRNTSKATDGRAKHKPNKRNEKRMKRSNGTIVKRRYKRKTRKVVSDNEHNEDEDLHEISAIREESVTCSDNDHTVDVPHMNSDTEIDDDECDGINDAIVVDEGVVFKTKTDDSDATEIDDCDNCDDFVPQLEKESVKRRLTKRPKKVSSRLKASEESEVTSVTEESLSAYTMSPSVSELTEIATSVSDLSHIDYDDEENDDDELMIEKPRRSSRRSRGIHSQWNNDFTNDNDGDFDLRSASLGLRNKRNNIKVRTRNSGRSRVRYNYDDDDFEYDGRQMMNDSNSVSSRGRIRKLKAHARRLM